MHYANYDHITGVTCEWPDGKSEWLPMTTSTGQAGNYAFGRFWVNWTFRSNSARVYNSLLERGLQRYTMFWCGQRKIDPTKVTFRIHVKAFDRLTHWEGEKLSRLCAIPWQVAGSICLRDYRFQTQLANIEEMQPLDEQIQFATLEMETETPAETIEE